MGFPRKGQRRARPPVQWRFEGFYLQFDRFDPLGGSVPAKPFPSLPLIAARARELIQGRTHDEVVHAARTADWLIDQYFRQKRIPGRIRLAAEWVEEHWTTDESSPASLAPASTSEVFALAQSIGTYRLDDNPNFRNGHQFEFLAVFALWKIADALQSFPLLDALRSPEGRRGLLGSEEDFDGTVPGGQEVLAAVEATCWAERLKATEELRQEVSRLTVALGRQTTQSEDMLNETIKKRVSLAASKAAIQRHAENREMKVQVIEYYEANQHNFNSMDAAAEAIAGKLVPLKFRTVRGYLSEYRRGLRSARRL